MLDEVEDVARGDEVLHGVLAASFCVLVGVGLDVLTGSCEGEYALKSAARHRNTRSV